MGFSENISFRKKVAAYMMYLLKERCYVNLRNFVILLLIQPCLAIKSNILIFETFHANTQFIC